MTAVNAQTLPYALDKKTAEGYNINSGEPYGLARVHAAVRRGVCIKAAQNQYDI